MKAIRLHDYGDGTALRYEDAPEPTLDADDVLVRVRAAGVNPADWQFRRGDFRAIAPLRFPAILGWDVAGTVERVGPAAQGFAPGDPVFAMCDMSRPGSYAEYVAVRDVHLASAPRGLPLAHCAAVPLAALTAWHALFDLGQLQAGQSVLVHAATGGVGLFAVQLAKAAGAHVTATASPRNHDLIRTLGAERCIDYAEPDWNRSVRGFDLVIDGAGGDTREQSWAVLREHGLLVAVAMPPVDPTDAARRGRRTALAHVVPDGRRLREIASMIDAGQLRVQIDSEYPLAEAARAHARSESRHARGKILLIVGSPA